MAQLSRQDFELTKEFRKFGVLIDTDQARDEYLPKGVIIPMRRAIYVGCPDCDQMKSIMTFHGKVIGQKLHPTGAIHGGSCAFHPKSPLNNAVPLPVDYFLHHFQVAASVKHTWEVAAYSHRGCGAASMAGLTYAQQIELSLVGRGFLHEQLSSRGTFLVIPYFHIDYTEHRASGNVKDKRTYGVSRYAWLEMREDFVSELKALPVRLID